MAQIEDQELCQLFRAESQERLQKLDNGLLQLEQEPANTVLIEELLREAHSLKGAARMLGLSELQELAHHLEESFSDAHKGKLPLTPESVKRQFSKLDRMRQLSIEAVGDAQPSAKATESRPTEEPESGIDLSSSRTQSELLTPLTGEPAPLPPIPSNSRFDTTLRIETLRVEANRLDFLLGQAGELVVCRSHLQRMQIELDGILEKILPNNPDIDSLLSKLAALSGRLSEDNARLDTVTSEIESGIRNLRLLPVSTLLDLFPRMVHDLSLEQGKIVALRLLGGNIVVDKGIIEEMKAPLMHLLRNSIDHGIESPEVRKQKGKSETGVIEVHVSQDFDRVLLVVSDDGKGLDYDAIRTQAVKRGICKQDEVVNLDEAQLKALVMQPGLSTSKIITDISGRGVGLDVVRTTIERMHGSMILDSTSEKGVIISLGLPVSIISTRVLFIEEWGSVFAIPFEYVSLIRKLKPEDLRMLEERQCINEEPDIIIVSRLGLLIGLPTTLKDHDMESICVILNTGTNRFGVVIDRLVGEQEVVLKGMPAPIRRARNISGVTIMDSGMVCPVLNVYDLARSLHHVHGKPESASAHSNSVNVKRKAILLAEDSITTRIHERRILESAGYEVVPAVDGLDAWNQLSRRSFDAVVTDILMPNMDGLELTRKIRANKKFASLPVILVTSLSSEDDRKLGLEAGADAYLTKPEFDQTILLDCLKRIF